MVVVVGSITAIGGNAMSLEILCRRSIRRSLHCADADGADRHPEVVADLRLQLEQWREMTEAQKVRPDGEGADVSPEELEQLRTLGYAN